MTGIISRVLRRTAFLSTARVTRSKSYVPGTPRTGDQAAPAASHPWTPFNYGLDHRLILALKMIAESKTLVMIRRSFCNRVIPRLFNPSIRICCTRLFPRWHCLLAPSGPIIDQSRRPLGPRLHVRVHWYMSHSRIRFRSCLCTSASLPPTVPRCWR